MIQYGAVFVCCQVPIDKVVPHNDREQGIIARPDLSGVAISIA